MSEGILPEEANSRPGFKERQAVACAGEHFVCLYPLGGYRKDNFKFIMSSHYMWAKGLFGEWESFVLNLH